MNTLQRSSVIVGAVLTVSTLVALWLLRAWFTHDPAMALAMRVPGKDGTPPDLRGRDRVTDLRGKFQQFDRVPADLPGSWPKFRGADASNIQREGPPLADHWEEGGPPILWSVELGEGHAGPVILSGRVFLLDYDEKAKADAIRCFSLADGREIWRHSYTVSVKRNHGMSRTVPAVTDKYLITIGPRCHVVCLDPMTGSFRWGIDMQREYGTKEPLWYTGQCPLIDGDRAILAPCGTDVLMMAVDCETGAPVWKTPNPDKWDMSHSSIIPMTIAGKRMYVYCAVGGVVGVSAEANDAGTVLWKTPWNARVVAPSPVVTEDGKILATAGYGEGGMTLQVTEQNGVFSVALLEKHGPKDGIACEQQTPIYQDGLFYAIMPKDAGALRAQFVCYRPDGTLVWSSGQSERFGLGPFLLADNKFYVLNDEGELSVLRLSHERYERLGRAQILHGQDAWGPIAIAGDRMLLRDSKQMVCISLATKN